MRRRRSRIVGFLLLGLIVVFGISMITRRNAPVLIWFVVVGGTLCFEIAREWFNVTNRLRSNPRTGVEILKLVVGSYPYVAAMVFMVIFTYLSVRVLMGHTIDPHELQSLGRVMGFAVLSIFIGGFFLGGVAFIAVLIRGRKQMHTENSAAFTQRVQNASSTTFGGTKR